MEPMSDEQVADLERMDREQWTKRAPYIADFFTARELRLVANCVEYWSGSVTAVALRASNSVETMRRALCTFLRSNF